MQPLRTTSGHFRFAAGFDSPYPTSSAEVVSLDTAVQRLFKPLRAAGEPQGTRATYGRVNKRLARVNKEFR
jgi:hypothetical protein